MDQCKAGIENILGRTAGARIKEGEHMLITDTRNNWIPLSDRLLLEELNIIIAEPAQYEKLELFPDKKARAAEKARRTAEMEAWAKVEESDRLAAELKIRGEAEAKVRAELEVQLAEEVKAGKEAESKACAAEEARRKAEMEARAKAEEAARLPDLQYITGPPDERVCYAQQ